MRLDRRAWAPIGHAHATQPGRNGTGTPTQEEIARRTKRPCENSPAPLPRWQKSRVASVVRHRPRHAAERRPGPSRDLVQRSGTVDWASRNGAGRHVAGRNGPHESSPGGIEKGCRGHIQHSPGTLRRACLLLRGKPYRPNSSAQALRASSLASASKRFEPTHSAAGARGSRTS